MGWFYYCYCCNRRSELKTNVSVLVFAWSVRQHIGLETDTLPHIVAEHLKMPSRNTARHWSFCSCVSALRSEWDPYTEPQQRSAWAGAGWTHSDHGDLAITRCCAEGTWLDSLSMTSFTEMWAGGGWRKPEEKEGQLALKRKLEENQRPIQGRERILEKTQKKEIADTCVYVGNHHCQFCSLPRGSSSHFSLSSDGAEDVSARPSHEGTVTLMAAREKVPFKWQKWWEVFARSCKQRWGLAIQGELQNEHCVFTMCVQVCLQLLPCLFIFSKSCRWVLVWRKINPVKRKKGDKQLPQIILRLVNCFNQQHSICIVRFEVCQYLTVCNFCIRGIIHAVYVESLVKRNW